MRRYVGSKNVFVIIYDGGTDWVAAAQMVIAKYPWVSGMYCASHCASLMVKDMTKIPLAGKYNPNPNLTLTLTLTHK